MDQKQDNIRTMFATTLAFLDDNSSIWSGRPAFADAVSRAHSAVDAIGQAAKAQQTPTTGIADDKASARDALEEKMLEIADTLAALAAKNGDNNLGAKVEMTKSSLDRMTDDDLDDTADRLEQLATDGLPALDDYGTTAADVTELTNLRIAFSGQKTGPRQATVERSAKTQSIPQLITAARSIFRNEIDKLMTKFKQTQPDFYNGYFAARVIVDRAATQASKPAPAPAKPNP